MSKVIWAMSKVTKPSLNSKSNHKLALSTTERPLSQAERSAST